MCRGSHSLCRFEAPDLTEVERAGPVCYDGEVHLEELPDMPLDLEFLSDLREEEPAVEREEEGVPELGEVLIAYEDSLEVGDEGTVEIGLFEFSEETSLLDDSISPSLAAFMDAEEGEFAPADDGNEGFEADEESLEDLAPLEGEDDDEGPVEPVGEPLLGGEVLS